MSRRADEPPTERATAEDEAPGSRPVPQIGRCIGCFRPARLDDGVCGPCLSLRGRRWAEMSHRCRTEPEFALAVFVLLPSERAKSLFLAFYDSHTSQ